MELGSGGGTLYSATLNQGSWYNNTGNATYTQSVNVSGVTTSTEIIIVDVNLSSSDINANITTLNDWACINDCDQGNGTLTFICYGDAPTTSIPVSIVVM